MRYNYVVDVYILPAEKGGELERLDGVIDVSVTESFLDGDSCEVVLRNVGGVTTDNPLLIEGNGIVVKGGYYPRDVTVGSYRGLFEGEITEIEPDFPKTGTPTVKIKATKTLLMNFAARWRDKDNKEYTHAEYLELKQSDEYNTLVNGKNRFDKQGFEDDYGFTRIPVTYVNEELDEATTLLPERNAADYGKETGDTISAGTQVSLRFSSVVKTVARRNVETGKLRGFFVMRTETDFADDAVYFTEKKPVVQKAEESDYDFVKRLAKEVNFMFTIRDKVLFFIAPSVTKKPLYTLYYGPSKERKDAALHSFNVRLINKETFVTGGAGINEFLKESYFLSMDKHRDTESGDEYVGMDDSED